MSDAGDYLSARWRFLLNRVVRRIWFRASLYSVAAIAVALFGAFVAPYIDFPFDMDLASGSVDSILTILASSMLAVTTFSLSIMVSAYSAAASNSTPRATALLLDDSVASNTLASFLGSFLFAIVGIVGLSAQIYGERGRIVLFFATLVVIFLVTAALLRWIEQLTTFGRVGDTIRRVEEVSKRAAKSWASLPRLGAGQAPEEMPDGLTPLYRDATGYIQHIDMDALNSLAKRAGGTVHVRKLPGQLVHPSTRLALMEEEPDGDVRAEMADAFTIAPTRSFDQDPRYGLVVLSEIASRALSPAVNDPGTAIAVLTAGVRVFDAYCDGLEDREVERFEHVTAPDLNRAEMLEDFINPIARDGASVLEVQLQIQRSLEMIALANRDAFGKAAGRLSALSLKRALEKLDSTLEQSRLKRRAGWSLPDQKTGEAVDDRAARAGED